MIITKKIGLLGISLLVGFVIFVLYNTYQRATSQHVVIDSSIVAKVADATYQEIILAGGCFWCTESEYNHLEGVVSAVSGYTDTAKSYKAGTGPSYADVSSKIVRAREAVQVIYDPTIVPTSKILELYFRHINPVDDGGQFGDRGYQYSPAIYYLTTEQRDGAVALIKKIDATKKFDKPVVVEVLAYSNFYPAEEYHQDYKDKNAVRYNLYREGSGRNAYTRETWADTSPYVKELFGDIKKATIINNQTTTKNMPTTIPASWKNFTQAIKEERLKTLTSLQFNVTQKEGTESPHTNDAHTSQDRGIYVDVVSGEPLFSSNDKYDSGTGWPSFVKPLSDNVVTLHVDNGVFSTRTEVRSKIADSHLGHVFDDGPGDRGGKRYCMNGAALTFIPFEAMEKEGYREYMSQVK